MESKIIIDIKKLNDGDEKELGKVMKKYEDPLRYFANDMVKQDDVAEDIVENTFIKLHYKKKDFDTESALKNFLYRVVINESLNYLKGKKVRDAYAQDQARKSQDYHEQEAHSKMIRTELIKRCYETIEQLPSSCKEIYKLNFFEGLSYIAIAERLNISVENVRVQIHKARAILRLLKKVP